MKLSAARTAYYDATGKLSELVRQLGLAAIGIAWLLSTSPIAQQGRPAYLGVVLWLGVAALSLHVMQYLAMSAVWGFVSRFVERRAKGPHDIIPPDHEFVAHPAINAPAIVFFWAKTGALVMAYALLVWSLRGLVI